MILLVYNSSKANSDIEVHQKDEPCKLHRSKVRLWNQYTDGASVVSWAMQDVVQFTSESNNVCKCVLHQLQLVKLTDDMPVR